MSDFIVSSNCLLPNTKYSILQELSIKSLERVCIILSTQFSLPFDSIVPSERISWCRYRYQYFKQSLSKSIRSQTVNSRDVVMWVLFVSRGDRELLQLPSVEVTDNGITIIWIEVDHVDDLPDDYYRNTVMDGHCKKIAFHIRDSIRDVSKFLFLRVDSDDFISFSYLTICRAISLLLSASTSPSYFFNFPCGLMYSKKSHEVVTHVWPDSPFTFSCSFRDTLDITVWKWPHDEISDYVQNYPILTTKPMWCITVDHGNMLNTGSNYSVFSGVVSENDICANL